MKCHCGENWSKYGVCNRGHKLAPLQYTLGKIAVRDDAELSSSSVYVGQTVTGYPFTFNDNGVSKAQTMLTPQIGKPIMIASPKLSGEYIRTSNVKSWCELMTSNDKLILPKDFPIASFPNNINFEEGDVLIATLNSIYIAKIREDLMKVK
jgi:hypothetical protein